MFIVLVLLSFFMPLTFLSVGLVMRRHYPKEINSMAGYRTARSMKNMETWKEANVFSANLLIRYSLLVLLAVSVMTLLAAIVSRSCDIIAVIAILSVILSLAVITLTILLTESHLKKMFGE